MELLLSETAGIPRVNEYVRISVPFARGAMHAEQLLAIGTFDGGTVPLQTRVLKLWPDNSVKWLQLDFRATVAAGGTARYYLIPYKKPDSGAVSGIRVVTGGETWLVDTGAALFHLDAREFRPFSRVIVDGNELLAENSSSCLLEISGKGRPAPAVSDISLETSGPLRTTLIMRGNFPDNDSQGPGYTCRLDFFADSSHVILAFTLHNPRPALHPGGLWDLGDKGSLFIRELSLKLSFSKGWADEIRCSTGQGEEQFTSDSTDRSVSIYQESSGGVNWRSPLHRTCHGEVPLNLKGFRLIINNDKEIHSDRATPVVWCGRRGGRGVAVTLPRFWQEFPKEINADSNGIGIGLLPGCFPDLHELQGGEQHATTIHFDFNALPDELDWARQPLELTVPPEIYQKSGVIPDLPALADTNGRSEDLLDFFIKGPDELLAKREMIDEYGWRNFGEIYADHEAVYHQEEHPFISHYSNQYDICAGLYRKFFATGTQLWGTLAADLARHMLHIDIYHTEDDREEYNNGLFWHTDHYIPAGLATHRSFSREHLQKKQPQQCGGGPGAEHCYTSGLLLHYFLTGDTAYREALIKLTRWCLRSLHGPQTLLATIRRAARQITGLCRDCRTNRRAFPHFPFSRGTGNALNACLDAFEATDDRWFMEQAEHLIRGALHPDDDIAARNLLDAESAWSYTVMLAAVSRYLDTKREHGELDERFCHARASLLSYANWMVHHEYPYLDKPEILEYPNETWPAQDLRKSVILYHAARYAPPDEREALMDKARSLYEAAYRHLTWHSTSSFTRPVALMLQNGWIGAWLQLEPVPVTEIPDPMLPVTDSPLPSFNFCNVLKRTAVELMEALRAFNLRGELRWLSLRLQDIRYRS